MAYRTESIYSTTSTLVGDGLTQKVQPYKTPFCDPTSLLPGSATKVLNEKPPQAQQGFAGWMLKPLWGDLGDILEDLKVIEGTHANNPKGLGLPVPKNSNDPRYFFCHCALIDLLLLRLAPFVTHESMSGDLMIGV